MKLETTDAEWINLIDIAEQDGGDRPLSFLKRAKRDRDALLRSASYPLPALLARRATELDPDGVMGAYFFALELAGEAGEAANAVKKLWRLELGIPGSRATLKDVEDELADVVITAANLARTLGIDLFGKAIPRKFNEASDKFGVSTKWRTE